MCCADSVRITGDPCRSQLQFGEDVAKVAHDQREVAFIGKAMCLAVWQRRDQVASHRGRYNGIGNLAPSGGTRGRRSIQPKFLC